jgi:N-acetylglutamate synthase-like GNAT family acetyltransferase
MLDEKVLKAYTELMASRFIKDPGVMAQVNGLERAKMLFTLSCEGQILAFDQRNLLQVLENGKGLLIGYSSDTFTQEQLLEVYQQASSRLIETATETELLIMQDKSIKVNRITDRSWYSKYTDKDVYNLLVIVVDESLKGTGAFRRLLMPAIKQCDEKGLPIVLQTHNPQNVPIYEHFGFRIMESTSSEEIDLTCYCMMRRIF